MAAEAPRLPACARGYCVRCCAYGRHWYGVERTSMDTERPCRCACHARPAPTGGTRNGLAGGVAAGVAAVAVDAPLGRGTGVMGGLDRLADWVAVWYLAALHRQRRRRRVWGGAGWRAVPPPPFMAGWQTTAYLETAEGLFRAPTVAQALAVVRAACAGDDTALLYLEGLEEVLGVRR